MGLNNLRGELVRHGIKQKSVAKFLSMTPSNFNKKLSESIPFTIDELKAIHKHYMPKVDLAYLCESDGDVPSERERLHHYAEAIGNELTKDGTEPDEEADEIVQLFHDCAEVAPSSALRDEL